MTEQERSFLAGLPEEITIYRGFNGGHGEGMSWTLDRDKAIWFAKRFRSAPALATALAIRGDVHAFFSGRNEFEIVIDKVELLRREDIAPMDGHQAGIDAPGLSAPEGLSDAFGA